MKAALWFGLLAWRAWGKPRSTKSPVVKWGQSPTMLWVDVVVNDSEDEQVIIKENVISVSCAARGEQYDTELKLRRNIVPDVSSYERDSMKIRLTLKKEKEEPCWRYLISSNNNPPWLQRDYNLWKSNECQLVKELWREGYFMRQLEKKKGVPHQENDKKVHRNEWEEKIEDFRNLAVKPENRSEL